MFDFFKKKAKTQQQADPEKYNQEIRAYVSEGLIRVLFQTKDFTITCAANSAYAIYFHNEVDTKTNLTWGFYL